MKWSPQKARQKSTLPRKPAAAKRPNSANVQRQLSGGTKATALPGAAGKDNLNPDRVKSNKASKAQSQRGQDSLTQTKKPKQELSRNASNKQQLQRQKQQRPQKQLQQQQLNQKQGGAFQNQGQSQKRVNAESNRGNKSLNKGGQSKPKKVQRRN